MREIGREKRNNDKLDFKVRECLPKDIHTVMSVNERTLPENYPLFFYKQIHDRFHEAFLVAYLDDKPDDIIGYIMWRTERGSSAFKLGQVKKGHLVSLAVLPEYRRKGVARKLMEESMKVVSDYGVQEYVLEVRISNTGAIRLYGEQFGFEKIKIISHYYRDGEDAFYMCKNNDSENGYIPRSKEMTDEQIIKYYTDKKKRYLCYRCPNCKNLLLKSPSYALYGSVMPKENFIITCAYCGHKMNSYDISIGKYDI